MKLRITIGLVGSLGALAACALAAQHSAPEPISAVPDGATVSVAGLEEVEGVIVGDDGLQIDPETGFAVSAFPPTLPDTDWHHDAWIRNDCLRCHETGVGEAPRIRHVGLPELALVSKCRTCHVIEPGKVPMGALAEVDEDFMPNAFPPMMPNSLSHHGAWITDNCLMCHEDGVRDAPIVRHEGMPKIMLQAKCRTCHVQVRSNETKIWEDE